MNVNVIAIEGYLKKNIFTQEEHNRGEKVNEMREGRRCRIDRNAASPYGRSILIIMHAAYPLLNRGNDTTATEPWHYFLASRYVARYLIEL